MSNETGNGKLVKILKRVGFLFFIGLIATIAREILPSRSVNDFSVSSYVDRISANLPQKLDEYMTAMSVEKNGKVVTQTIAVADEYIPSFQTEGQYKALSIYYCFGDEKESLGAFLKAGYSMKYLYIAKDGAVLGEPVIGPDVCSVFPSLDTAGLGKYISDEFNKMLPYEYAPNAWTVESRFENGTFRIANSEREFTRDEIDMENFNSDLKEYYRRYACLAPDTWSLMYQGGKVEFNFFDKNDEPIGIFAFEASDCSEVRGELANRLGD